MTVPLRNSNSLAIILLAVVAASPGTIRFSKTKKLAKIAGIIMIRSPNPATIAALRGDISAIRFVISIPPNLLAFVIMFHSYDYISLFVPFFDIPVSLGNLFQRIASINDRFYLSRLNKLFEEN